MAIGLSIALCMLPVREFVGNRIPGILVLLLLCTAVSVVGTLLTRALGKEDAEVLQHLERKLLKRTHLTDRLVGFFEE